MMSSMPARTVRVSESKLNSYMGVWTDISRQVLKTFGYSSNVVVKVFSYFDGSILVKYHVVIHLPVELGLHVILPYGEACYSCDGARKELWHLVDVGAVCPCAW
jgi:hypothetical protein